MYGISCSRTISGVLFCILLNSLLLISISGCHSDFRQGAESISLKLLQPGDSIHFISQSDESLDLKFSLRDRPYLIVPIKKPIRNEKLHLSFSKLKKIKQIIVRPGISGVPAREDDFIHIPVGRAGGLRLDYNILLPDGNYDTLRIEFRGGSSNAEAALSEVSLLPTSVADSALWVYALTIVVAAYILLPGILLFPLFHRRIENQDSFQCFLAAYSIFFYMVGYLIWIVCTRLNFEHADLITLIYIMFGVTCIGYMHFYMDRGVTLFNRLRNARADIIIYVIVLLAMSFLITSRSNLPMENTWYSTISGPKTYNAFRAHDAVFQYVNGFAISNDEPFKKYYGRSRLIYGVEDREILPGTLYAVFRSTFRNVSSRIADSFLIYTIFSTGLNLLIIFPVLSFCRRYVGNQNSALFILAFSLNGFVMINYYLAWFKMAGGAFFLCGLYTLMQARTNLQWGTSGMLFGIGTNMHAGSALGIPFFFIWAVVNRVIDASGARFRSLIAPCVLILAFVFLNLPWATIKHHYLRDNNALIKVHFLNGVSHPGGLVKSIELFFEKVPLSEQWGPRFKRLRNSFRLDEVKKLIETSRKKPFSHLCLLWNQYEFRFVVFSFYPLLILLFIMSFINKIKTHHINSPSETVVSVFPQMALILIGLSAITIVSIILLSYGSHAPDLNYHLPMGVTILAYSLLLGFIFNFKGFIHMIPIIYFAFSSYRLFSVY